SIGPRGWRGALARPPSTPWAGGAGWSPPGNRPIPRSGAPPAPTAWPFANGSTRRISSRVMPACADPVSSKVVVMQPAIRFIRFMFFPPRSEPAFPGGIARRSRLRIWTMLVNGHAACGRLYSNHTLYYSATGSAGTAIAIAQLEAGVTPTGHDIHVAADMSQPDVGRP